MEKIAKLEKEHKELSIKYEDLGLQLKNSQNLLGNLTHSLISSEVFILIEIEKINKIRQNYSKCIV